MIVFFLKLYLHYNHRQQFLSGTPRESLPPSCGWSKLFFFLTLVSNSFPDSKNEKFGLNALNAFRFSRIVSLSHSVLHSKGQNAKPQKISSLQLSAKINQNPPDSQNRPSFKQILDELIQNIHRLETTIQVII